ncbi:conserved hypothetical protein [Klebsiella grimontii]|uniref:Uncharacterized protein n=1 Tax=Klebsiella grimontii TaxID=2058152 RepID=A0A285B1P9_9ENTR|nr:conserved hypothetical protein [Klebsiella grimontii]
MLNGKADALLLGDNGRHRFVPLGCVLQIAFAIGFYFITVKDKHDSSHTAENGGSVAKNKAPHKRGLRTTGGEN